MLGWLSLRRHSRLPLVPLSEPLEQLQHLIRPFPCLIWPADGLHAVEDPRQDGRHLGHDSSIDSFLLDHAQRLRSVRLQMLWDQRGASQDLWKPRRLGPVPQTALVTAVVC